MLELLIVESLDWAIMESIPFDLTVPSNVSPRRVISPSMMMLQRRQHDFKLKNTSNVDTTFDWSFNQEDDALPFKITPSTGILRGGESIKMTLQFCPIDARTYNCEARCEIGNLPSSQVQPSTTFAPVEPAGHDAALQLPAMYVWCPAAQVAIEHSPGVKPEQ